MTHMDAAIDYRGTHELILLTTGLNFFMDAKSPVSATTLVYFLSCSNADMVMTSETKFSYNVKF